MTLVGSEIDAAEWARLAAITEGEVPTVAFLQAAYASAFGGLRWKQIHKIVNPLLIVEITEASIYCRNG